MRNGGNDGQVLWFAYQDGNGPWTRVTGINNVFTFNISSAVAGIAFVLQLGSTTQTTVSLMTRAELTTAPFSLCPATPGTKSVTGTMAGLGSGDVANLFLGLGSGFAAGNGNFVVNGVLPGRRTSLHGDTAIRSISAVPATRTAESSATT